jgi:NAD(P)-dependent dehydrogenase (short-subunit alcohol dehydrogenase family)
MNTVFEDAGRPVSKTEFVYFDKERLGVIFHLLDVTNQDHINTISKQIEQEFGRLDVLVNNAASHYDSWQYAIDADLNLIEEAMVTNVYGPWRLCQAFIPTMKQSSKGQVSLSTPSIQVGLLQMWADLVEDQ